MVRVSRFSLLLVASRILTPCPERDGVPLITSAMIAMVNNNASVVDSGPHHTFLTSKRGFLSFAGGVSTSIADMLVIVWMMDGEEERDNGDDRVVSRAVGSGLEV
jgi:hypothetical protein